jgi:uncharacterized protein YeaC (DUF1315 family)
MEKEEIKEYKKERAIERGQDYFESVKDTLKRALKEVERNEKHWREAIDNGNYPDGSSLPNELKTQKIERTVNYLEQINLRATDACLAIAQLAVAFDIEY